MSHKKLNRTNDDKMLFGVCGGLANYFNVDVTWIRLGFVAAFLLGGHGLLLYGIGAIVIPRRAALPGADYKALQGAARY